MSAAARALGASTRAVRAAAARIGALLRFRRAVSLKLRLIGLLTALLIGAQVGIGALWQTMFTESLAARVGERLVLQAQAVQTLLEALPEADWSARAAQLSGPSLRVLVDPPGAPASGERAIERVVQGGGGPDALSGADQRLLAALRAQLGARYDLRITQSDARPTAWLRLQVRDTPVWVSTPLLRRPAPPPWTDPRLIVVGLATLVGAALVVWLVNRPLDRLVRAIDRAEPASRRRIEPEGLPDELVRVTAAFDRLLAELERREREREQLLAGVSHDLRSPLARLRLRLESIEPDAVRDGVGRDVDAIDRIASQFLAYVRSAEPPAAGRTSPVVDEVEAVVSRYREFGHDVRLEARSAEGFALDGQSVERIASNLVDNALAHGAPPVTVRLEAEGDALVLAVVDRGPGMSPEAFGRAREPFVRLDAARSRSGQCGLGLAIVDRLAGASGARVEAGRSGEAFEVRVRWPQAAGLVD